MKINKFSKKKKYRSCRRVKNFNKFSKKKKKMKNLRKVSKKMNGGRHLSRKEMEELKHIQPGDNIDNKIRAFWFPPYDGANIEIDGGRYTVVNRSILEALDGDSEAIFRHTQIGS